MAFKPKHKRIAKTSIERGRIIWLLYTASLDSSINPIDQWSLDVDVIERSLYYNNTPIARDALVDASLYLENKGYVECIWDDGDRSQLIRLRITSKGKDLCEQLIADSGVFVPEV